MTKPSLIAVATLFFLPCGVLCNLQKWSITPPHSSIMQEMHTEPERLLVSGGPPNPRPISVDAFALPQLTLFENSTIRILEDIKHGLKYLFQTSNAHTLTVIGTASTGIEIVLGNLVQPGESVLILHSGLWSENVMAIVTRLRGTPLPMEKEEGLVFTMEEIELEIQVKKPDFVYVVHGESSTGIYQGVDKIGEMCQKHNCITILDVVHVVGLQPFFMDLWKIDAVVCNSHKGIGAPVGMTPMSFSSRAVNKIMSRTTPTTSQLNDFQLWKSTNYWGFDPTRTPQFHHSLPILMLYTLRVALAQVSQVGLRTAWEKHARVDAYFRKRLKEEMPFLQDWVKTPSHRLLGAVMITFPFGHINSTVAREYMIMKHRIDISDGIGDSRGKVLRVALIGQNSNFEAADRIIRALRETFFHFNLSKNVDKIYL